MFNFVCQNYRYTDFLLKIKTLCDVDVEKLDKGMKICYLDEDRDWVCIGNKEDWEEAKKFYLKPTLKMKVMKNKCAGDKIGKIGNEVKIVFQRNQLKKKRINKKTRIAMLKMKIRAMKNKVRVVKNNFQKAQKMHKGKIRVFRAKIKSSKADKKMAKGEKEDQNVSSGSSDSSSDEGTTSSGSEGESRDPEVRKRRRRNRRKMKLARKSEKLKMKMVRKKEKFFRKSANLERKIRNNHQKIQRKINRNTNRGRKTFGKVERDFSHVVKSDGSYMKELQILKQIGFGNMKLNLRLLAKHGGNLPKVCADLICK